jgi:hypothetical protein
MYIFIPQFKAFERTEQGTLTGTGVVSLGIVERLASSIRSLGEAEDRGRKDWSES